MGRTSDEEGETSTKVCKSDDIDDRPLKKARYVWQIKGKYHLKKQDDNKLSCFATKSSVEEEPSVLMPCKHTACNTDSNLNNIDESENNSALSASNPLSENKSNPERGNSLVNIADCEVDNVITLKKEKFSAASSEWPVALNAMFPNTRPTTSWHLRKWQARQVARCFVDNTINRVLEDMGFVPLPVDADDILDEFPVTESENEEGLEDEAVLMAIHRHGLRTEGQATEPDNKILDTIKIDSANSKVCGELCSAVSLPCVCSVTRRQDANADINLNPFHHRPVFWDQGEMDTRKLLHPSFSSEFNSNEIVNKWFSDGLFNSVVNGDSSCDSDIKSCEETVVDVQTSLKECSPIPGIVKVQDNVDISEESCSLEKQGDTISSNEHNDFLDKAVAVAIQKKGLSKLSCADYG